MPARLKPGQGLAYPEKDAGTGGPGMDAEREELHIIVVEDAPADAELELRELKRAGLRFSARRVETETDFRCALAELEPHVILSDFTMPRFDGMQALALARELAPDVPFIFVSGTIGEEYAIRAMKNGATDYVLKNNLVRLPAAVERALRDARNTAERKGAEAWLRLQGAALNAAANAIVITRLDGTIRWVNQAFSMITGYSADEAIGQNPRILRSGRHDAEFYRRIYDTILGGSVWQGEIVNRYKDGRVATEEMTITPVRGDGGEITDFIAIKQDVSARKEAEEHRARLSAILEASPDFVATADPNGNVLYCNSAARRLLDLPDDVDPSQIKISKTHPQWAADLVLTVGIPCAIRDGVWRSETAFITRSGREIPVIQVILAHKGSDGRLEFLSTIARDISELKDKELRISRLNRVYAVLSGINTLIVHVRDRQKLFEESCRIAVAEGQFPFAWIGVLDPATQDVTPVAWAGKEAETLIHGNSSARHDLPKGQGAVGLAIRERRAVFNNNIAASTFGGPRRHEILRLGFQSQITLPLFEAKTVVGTLTMYAREPNFFDQEELKLLEELAGDISFAVETLAKEQKLEKLSRIRAVSSAINTAIVRIRDREALLRETCRIVVEDGKFEMVWVAALDPVKQEIRPVSWAGFTPEAAHAVNWASINAARGTLGEAILTRNPAVRNDIGAELPVGKLRQEALQNGCPSTVCLPLGVDGNVVALIALFAPGVGFFDEEELALLNEVAGNISFALEHIQKEEKIARLSRIQAVTSSINALIVRVRNRQELFDEACRIAVECGGFGIAWIGTLDLPTLEVTPVAHAGLQAGDALVNFKSSANIEHPLGRGVVGRAIRERMPVFVDDLTKEPGAGERRREAIRRGYHSRIALPLLVDNGVVAVMVLFATERNYFNQDEVKLLTELAGDISFALEHIGKEEKLNYLAYYDALTGLPNRTLLEERLGRQLHLAREKGTKVAVLLGNVNRFRFINESLGRHAGDALLRELAARAKKVWPDSENVARISADSFGGIVADLNDETEIAHLPGQLVTEVLKLPFRIEDKELTITMAAGIAIFPTDGSDADAVFRNAEAALKRAKASGEQYLFYRPEMNARVAETLQLENKLRRALDREEFVLHYQPKLDLAKGTISSVEALIRWNDPESGLVPPVNFIPLLEETGMILEAGRWAMRKAVAEYRSWCSRGLRPPRIAVNVSPIQLRQKNFVDIVREAIGGATAETHGLDLEITESLIMEDIDGNIEKLRAVRDMGVSIAIDDFGTGYSSLRYLAKLPVNAVKIDRSFIITMVNDSDSMTIVSTIISLAHSLNLRVVAEGVDAEEQRRFLKLLRCDEMQGYLFSRAVPALDLEALLAARRNGE